LVVLAAGGAAAAQLTMPPRLPLSGPSAAASPAAFRRAGPPPRLATLYPAIGEHPLFSPTRQPYVPPKAPAPAAVAEHSALRDYQLLGTVVEGVTSVAILKPPGSRETIRAIPGQTIAGWKLREITPDALEFENGAARLALHFPRPRWPHQ
ncbi:MAG: hypothetical protein ACREDL_17895, partial [Bradyrhizobium sp.]